MRYRYMNRNPSTQKTNIGDWYPEEEKGRLEEHLANAKGMMPEFEHWIETEDSSEVTEVTE